MITFKSTDMKIIQQVYFSLFYHTFVLSNLSENNEIFFLSRNIKYGEIGINIYIEINIYILILIYNNL